ncbi:MAG: class I SAM-dependent methyltransferase [Undibacterium sp.]|nr:class I SAM-dependent methyltransferase [Opitutaceae bacterium]
MSDYVLQRCSVSLFSAMRRAVGRGWTWVRARPALAAWFFDAEDDSPEARFREFNGWYFANFYEQEKMLADRPRMAFYHAAITRHIQPGDRVIDLGTGTGILAAFAARRGAAQVYAVDHSEILRHAKTLAVANGIQKVEFISMHSSKLELAEPVDVILHEQMGDCLFDEAMVTNVCDLRDRLLKPGGLILPSCFDLYCEPVKLNDVRHVPHIWELNVHGYDYSSLGRQRPQEPDYYHLRSCDPDFVDHFLGEPEPVMSVDLHTINEADMALELNFTRTVLNAGRLDGYAVYFRARVDGDLALGSGPKDVGRAPHWGFRILRTDRDDFAAGDQIDVRLTVGRWTEIDTWRWSHVKRAAVIEAGV